jgi:5-hydroxyisourate hydrolase-like protein (transthyretin family)
LEDWKGWLLNRVTITFGLIAVVVIAWNLYVQAHDDGILEGQVVNEAGEPVAGAKVVLSERTIVSMTSIAETVTDADGRFHFEGHDRHALVLTAEMPDLARSARMEVQLYFKNQNRRLASPIVLSGAA